ncbi:MAG TPA: 23S rRNA (adenine(2503)-C(2))-methyltransferase RlmN [Candidatus Deferrimicrobiaceae bacterium]|jgi:23S rRNA (adenine2503-C2)-methyltransferase
MSTELKGMTISELEAFFFAEGKERFRARQLSRWLYQRYVDGFEAMTDLSKPFREQLAQGCTLTAPVVDTIESSGDGTEKYLFRLQDGHSVESVMIPEEGRTTLCVSSQVGCAMRCGFCATGAVGFKRNMTASEIVNQAIFAAKRLASRGEKLTNIVFMGMGEPLENFEEVCRVVDILLSVYGFHLSGKRVTVSTSGIIPEMLSLSERYPVSIAVSLNAARDDLRSALMPINRKYPLRDLVQAMRKIPLHRGRKVTVEYVLLKGVNDSPSDAREVARLLKGIPVKMNLIPFNAHEFGEFVSPPQSVADAFRDILVDAGMLAITRGRRGDDIRAACGQLSAGNTR